MMKVSIVVSVRVRIVHILKVTFMLMHRIEYIGCVSIEVIFKNIYKNMYMHMIKVMYMHRICVRVWVGDKVSVEDKKWCKLW